MAGCQTGDNNFARHVDMEAGKAYALVINNFSNTGNGFSIDWGGTGTFRGPKAEIFVDLLEGEDFVCDRAFEVDQEVEFALGNIKSYSWNFGTDAVPQRIEGPGIHEVIYTQVGEKSIVLTVETDSGCIVNEVVTVEIESCCEDTTALSIALDDTEDLRCHGIPEGLIDVSAMGGTPGYQYSLDNDFYQFNDFFDMLMAGPYRVYARDIKGCVDSLDVSLIQPPLLNIDAGPDQVVELGFGTSINSTLQPPGWTVNYHWRPDSLVNNPFGPNVFVTPPGTTEFTISIVDPNGCTDMDTVIIFTTDNRPIYIPTAITPNDDGINDRFTAYGNPAARRIEVLRIYNRWGSKVYEDFNFPVGDERFGWDGTFNGEKIDPGVLAYYIEISFIDGVQQSYKGNIHIIH
jgi:gliding motility-associated-like protein